MGCEAGWCKTSTPWGIFIVIPLLEGWPTKAKEAPSPHEVRLAPLDTNPVFQSLVKCVLDSKLVYDKKIIFYYLLSENLVNLGIIIVLSTVILQCWRAFLFCTDNFVEICKKHVLHMAKLLPYETNDHENPK